MATPDFILALREKIGHDMLWIPGCTAIVARPYCSHPVHQSPAAGMRGKACQNTSAPFEATHPHCARMKVDEDFFMTPLAPEHVEILIVERADNGWATPVTGIVDPGEEAADAAVREVLEETGVSARPLRLLSTQVVGPVTYDNADQALYLDLAFLLRWDAGEPWPADAENTSAQFIRADRLPAMNNRFTKTVRRALSGEIAAEFTYSLT
ncbi:NUDIX hydrolase [Schaalia sp. lx-100]|uniref:NUDIX hydrolase n=1 Tax=Schaalia sp. lx-100 TaxID=2899081 RepID=UPI0022AC5C54|nr:NUDIX domain-containing protein [Schaalia sp. lx-100]